MTLYYYSLTFYGNYHILFDVISEISNSSILQHQAAACTLTTPYHSGNNPQFLPQQILPGQYKFYHHSQNCLLSQADNLWPEDFDNKEEKKLQK